MAKLDWKRTSERLRSNAHRLNFIALHSELVLGQPNTAQVQRAMSQQLLQASNTLLVGSYLLTGQALPAEIPLTEDEVAQAKDFLWRMTVYVPPEIEITKHDGIEFGVAPVNINVSGASIVGQVIERWVLLGKPGGPNALYPKFEHELEAAIAYQASRAPGNYAFNFQYHGTTHVFASSDYGTWGYKVDPLLESMGFAGGKTPPGFGEAPGLLPLESAWKNTLGLDASNLLARVLQNYHAGRRPSYICLGGCGSETDVPTISAALTVAGHGVLTNVDFNWGAEYHWRGGSTQYGPASGGIGFYFLPRNHLRNVEIAPPVMSSVMTEPEGWYRTNEDWRAQPYVYDAQRLWTYYPKGDFRLSKIADLGPEWIAEGLQMPLQHDHPLGEKSCLSLVEDNFPVW